MSRPSDAADPVALRSPAMCRFFMGVMRRQMGAAFRAVRLARPGLPDLPEGRPVVVYANHPSWWDPAFFIVLVSEFFRDREGYGPIDAEMLDRYRFMRRIGLFGIDRDPRRGGAAFLRTAEHIVADPRRMLWVTAQGDFADPRDRPVALRGGVARLMTRRPEVIALPLALDYPFWSEKRPEALAGFGAPVMPRPGDTADTLNTRLAAALEDTMDGLAARAIARDPGQFTSVIRGRAGVGGVYGLWGRLRSAATGHRHAADHLPDHAADHGTDHRKET